MASTQGQDVPGANGGDGGKEDDKKKPAVPETDTDELKRFREKWKRELQPTQPTSAHHNGSATTSSSVGDNSSHSSSISSHATVSEHDKQNISFHHRHITGENKLIVKFLTLLEEEELNENEGNTNNNENKQEIRDNQLKSHIGVLPSELQLAIFSHLHVKALETCSTVCRFWYILARYFLFS